ncbi:uncharacterized protein PG986_013995 [Apiospora aurea]|uniref:Uncharacterized protein n=1 Tax=Apiospora aurea TaxID=335848 RepID=A0ABR1PX56_9PEZI
MRLHLATASLLLGLALSAVVPPQRGRPDAQTGSGGSRKPAPVRPLTGGEKAVAAEAVLEIVKTTSDLVQSVFPAQDTDACRALVSDLHRKVEFCNNRALDKQRRDKCFCDISQGSLRDELCALTANQNMVSTIMGESKSLCQECRLGQKGCS